MDFLQDMAARYGPQGSFWSDPSDAYDPSYVPMTRVQIWNEPSSQFYWRQKPNAKNYGALVKASDDALEAVDPSIGVVLAGVFPDPVMGASIPYTKFLAKLYDVKGIAGAFDSAGFHPYASSIKRLKSQVKTMRKLMRQGGVKSKPLYITEIGWGSAPRRRTAPCSRAPRASGPCSSSRSTCSSPRAGNGRSRASSGTRGAIPASTSSSASSALRPAFRRGRQLEAVLVLLRPEDRRLSLAAPLKKCEEGAR